MIRRNATSGSLAAIAFAITVAGCGAKKDAAPPVATLNDTSITLTAAQRSQIGTEKVDQKSFNPELVEKGTVNFNGDKSTQVIPAISGPVSRILVNPGDSVVAGQALALVASPDFAANVAAFRKAESALRNAQRIVTLDEKLFASDALARAELDQARSDLSAAEADRDAAAQQLASIGIDSASIESIRLGKTAPGAQSAIRAPIAGIVVEKLINPGQLLQAGGAPAFTIADLSTVWVMGNVFENDIGAVAKGQAVSVTTGASSDVFHGTVDYVSALVDPGSKATQVRLLVSNPKRMLKQNMLVDVTIHGSKSRTGITIPVAAVLRDDDNLPFVYLDAGNNHFARRRITLGDRIGDQYVVRAGLQVGETVVTQGALFLQEAGGQ
jgi:membrane fusion protein, heavy metal efflux system